MFQGDTDPFYEVYDASTDSYDVYSSTYAGSPDAIVIPLSVINNPNKQENWGTHYASPGVMASDSETLIVPRAYLVYGHTNAFYNGHSLRPEVLLKNIF